MHKLCIICGNTAYGTLHDGRDLCTEHLLEETRKIKPQGGPGEKAESEVIKSITPWQTNDLNK